MSSPFPPPLLHGEKSFDDEPGSIKAIAIMTTVGGGVAILFAVIDLFLALFCCVTILTAPYSIVVGVLALMKGIRLLNDRNRAESAPYTTAIMQIINIVSLDFVNLALGIVILVLLSTPEVKNYYRR